MNTKEEKLRGMFVIKIDKYFDQTHPLWETIQSYKIHLAETHVLVFSRTPAPKRKMFVELEPGLFLYHASSRSILFHVWRTWNLLAFQLLWRRSFRADFVLSFTPGRGGLFAYMLAKRFHRPYFLVASYRMALGAPLSLKRMIVRFLLRRATAVFVPGTQNALSLSKLLSIAQPAIIPIQPPVDIASITHTTDRKDYHLDHPQYNFFISSAAAATDTIRQLLLIHTRIVVHYPRTALVILAPHDKVDRLNRFVRRSRSAGVYIYPHDDVFLSKLVGSHVYLSTEVSDEVDTTLLSALAIGVPVVAYRTEMVQELFANTPFERFAIDQGDVEGAAERVIELIEHLPTRNNYAINTGVLSKHVPSRDTGSYVRAMYDSIEYAVRPAPVGHSAEGMYLKGLEKLREEK